MTEAAVGDEIAVIQSVDGAGPWARIRLAGELDCASADVIRQAIDGVLSTHTDATVVEIDIEDVTFMDSTGVGVLVVGHRDLAGRGIRLIVTNPAKTVERLMNVTGVYEILTGASVSTPHQFGSAGFSAAH